MEQYFNYEKSILFYDTRIGSIHCLLKLCVENFVQHNMNISYTGTHLKLIMPSNIIA